MRNTTLIIVVVLLCACFVTGAEVEYRISEIGVLGNRTITEARILGRIRSREGMLFSPDMADEDTARIAELEGVELAYYNTEVQDGSVKLTYVVEEEDYVREIVFEGRRKVSEGKLKNAIGTVRGDYVSMIQAELDREALLELYQEKGYPFAEVELKEEELVDGRLVFEIDEGARAKIGSISFEGNEELSDKQLKKIAKLKKKKLLLFNNYYYDNMVEKSADNLRQGYYERGFLDREVEVEVDYSDDAKVAHVTFLIDEGPAYEVAEIVIEGNEFYSDEKLSAMLDIGGGRRFSGVTAERNLEDIRELYLEQGFINSNVELVTRFVGEDRVKVVLDIDEGERFRIGRVDISGNVETQDKVVRRVLDEYDFTPGEWYDGEAARGTGQGSVEKIVRQTTLMESVLITADGNMPGQRTAQVSVTEGKTGSVVLGAGVASNSGVIGQIVFEQRNFDIKDTPDSFSEFITGQAFKGAGQKMRISIMPGTELSEYSVHFTEPYLNDQPVALDLIGSSYERQRETYDEARMRGLIGLEKRFSKCWRGSVGFRAENVDIEDIDFDAPKEVKDLDGETALFGFKVGVSRDVTDNKFLPTTGDIFKTYVEQVVGDFSFTVVSATYRRFWTVYEDLADKKTVLATKVQASQIFGEAPVFEKFYAGGQGSIRGFDYRGVSPRGVNTATGEKDEPIGSDTLFLANTELTIPLTEEALSLLLFVDSGCVETGGYRVGAGAGLQIMIPQWFGPVPMRFEFGSALLKDDLDDTQAFSFSVGRLF